MDISKRSRANDEASGATLDRLLRLAGARKSKPVALVGGTVDDLIELYRRGYRQVALMRQPPRGTDDADAVVLDGSGTVAEIAETLTRFRPLLDRAEILVVRRERSDGEPAARGLWPLLAARGFTPMLQIGARSDFVMLARRADRGVAALAA
jgi:poly(3-hydroxybutyrate) depolymerase